MPINFSVSSLWIEAALALDNRVNELMISSRNVIL